jgi:hypothetical protein
VYAVGYPERLLTRDGVGTNQRVDRRHGRTLHNTAACESSLGLFMARVQSFETPQALTEGGSEATIRSGLVEEERIASCFRDVSSA